MSLPFPEPTARRASQADVLLGYYRSVLVDKSIGLPAAELRGSRLPSGWTPLQLLRHLTFVERRWLVWGFEGESVAQPWGDERDGRWYVGPQESLDDLLVDLHAQADRSRQVVSAHELSDVGPRRPPRRGARARRWPRGGVRERDRDGHRRRVAPRCCGQICCRQRGLPTGLGPDQHGTHDD